MKFRLAALALAALCGSSPGFAALLLHSDSFEAGDPVSYTTNFGSPAISGPANLFNGNALVFNNIGNQPTYYEQIEYGVYSDSLSGQIFTIGFDFYVENLVGNTVRDRDALFTVFLDDYDTLNRIQLDPAGNLFIDNLSYSGRTTLSGFQNSQVYRFLMTYNLQDNWWGVSINGSPVWSSAISYSTRLRDLRFNLGGRSPGNFTGNLTNVVLDNVKIESSEVPLPAGLGLFVSGLASLLLGRARRPAVTSG